MNDIAVRAFKTFIQAFLGVLIPELCLILNSASGVELDFAPAVFVPLLCASLSAGISALWNFLQVVFNSEEIIVDTSE